MGAELVGALPRQRGPRLRPELVRLGLVPGPRPAEVEMRPRSERLAELLGGQGPLGAAFGRYLSRRVDLEVLGPDERDALARLPVDAAGPRLQVADVRRRAAAALGRRMSLLADVVEQPELSDWSGDWHHARHVDGRRLRLFLARSEVEADVASASLVELASALGWPRSAVEDFTAHVIAPRLDLGRRSQLLTRLASSAGPVLVAPKVVEELGGESVLAVEDRDGAEGLLAGGPLHTQGPAAARLLASSFLELLARHRLLADDLVVARLGDGRAFLLDAGLWELPQAQQVLDYLRATAGGRLDDVAQAWRGEALTGGVDLEGLRSKLRQATPRRDGPRRAGESSVEYAIAYWRVASACGLALRAPWLPAFPALEGLGRRLVEWQPKGDPMSDALVEQAWRDGWGRVREMASSPDQIGSLLDRYATTLLDAPATLDRMLDVGTSSARVPTSRRHWLDALSVLAAWGALALAVRTFGHLEGVETAAGVLFLAVAAGFFRGLFR